MTAPNTFSAPDHEVEGPKGSLNSFRSLRLLCELDPSHMSNSQSETFRKTTGSARQDCNIDICYYFGSLLDYMMAYVLVWRISSKLLF